jgi:hypothetical protein
MRHIVGKALLEHDDLFEMGQVLLCLRCFSHRRSSGASRGHCRGGTPCSGGYASRYSTIFQQGGRNGAPWC